MDTFTKEQTKHINSIKPRLFWYSQLFDVTGVRPKWAQEIMTHVRPHHLFISGGCIASLLQGEEPRDIDIYCKDKYASEVIRVTLARQLPCHRLDVKATEEYEYTGMHQDHESSSAMATTMYTGHSFITGVWGEPSYITGQFDYKHSTPYYDFFTGKLYISKSAYDAAVHKKLVPHNFKTMGNFPYRRTK